MGNETSTTKQLSVTVHQSSDHQLIIPHFFRLSGELRNRIYRRVLVSKTDKALYAKRLPKEPAILAVSHRIREEASSIYYGETVFKVTEAVTMRLGKDVPGPVEYVSETSVLRQWLQMLGPDRTGLIKHVRLLYDRGCDTPVSLVVDEWEWEGRRVYADCRRLRKSWKADGSIERAAKLAARLMLKGVLEHGLQLSSIQPIPLRKMDPCEQEFQRLWIQAVGDLKQQMTEEKESESCVQ